MSNRSVRPSFAAIVTSLFVGAGLCPPLASGQQIETNPAAFRRPVLIVLPDPPPAVAERGESREYLLGLAVDERGGVAIRSVEPDEPDFRAALEAVHRYWIFFPRLDAARCIGAAGEGVLKLSYRPGAGEPTIGFEMNPMRELVPGDTNDLLSDLDPPRYPDQEAARGQSGDLWILSEIAPDGRVRAARLLVGVPALPAFVKTATNHARFSRFRESTRPSRCVLRRYSFVLRD